MLNYTEFLFQIIICFLLSACIGIERQYRRRTVGLRTIILVSLGSFLFVRFSFAFPGSDMTRIAAQVVAGIGFLGAGVIIKDNNKTVKGLTTAATLWCAAAIGILCSANLLFEAGVGTLLILFTNIILRTVNTKINLLNNTSEHNIYIFEIICDEKNEKEILKIIKDICKDTNATINKMENSEMENGDIKLNVTILVNSSKDNIVEKVMKILPNRKDIISMSFTKKDQKTLYDEEEL